MLTTEDDGLGTTDIIFLIISQGAFDLVALISLAGLKILVNNLDKERERYYNIVSNLTQCKVWNCI